MDEVAVITDAMSGDYFLPAWVDYYGRQFGRNNLYIFAYDRKIDAGSVPGVNLFDLNFGYNQALRVWFFNDAAEELLQRYSCVIRVDADEFLAPDPRKYPRLRDYVAAVRKPHVTAVGLDVVQMTDEPPLSYASANLLAGRHFGVKASAYSKTCIVRQGVGWSFGFHTATVPPVFDDLYLFHMKFADPARRIAWLDFLAEACRDDEGQYRHFKAANLEFQQTFARFQALPKRWGESAIRDRAYVARLERAVRRRDDGQYAFEGVETTEDALTEIPRDFLRLF